MCLIIVDPNIGVMRKWRTSVAIKKPNYQFGQPSDLCHQPPLTTEQNRASLQCPQRKVTVWNSRNSVSVSVLSVARHFTTSCNITFSNLVVYCPTPAVRYSPVLFKIFPLQDMWKCRGGGLWVWKKCYGLWQTGDGKQLVSPLYLWLLTLTGLEFLCYYI